MRHVATVIGWDRTDPEVVGGGGYGKGVGGVGVRSDDDGVALACCLSYMLSTLREEGGPTNTNRDILRQIWLNGNKIRLENLQHVVINSEAELCGSGSVDNMQQVFLSLLEGRFVAGAGAAGAVLAWMGFAAVTGEDCFLGELLS